MAHQDDYYYFLDARAEQINSILSDLAAIINDPNNEDKLLKIENGHIVLTSFTEQEIENA